MKIKNFSQSKFSPSLPPLFAFQLERWNWFWQKGLKELLDEFSPIYDYNRKVFKIDFIDYQLGHSQYDDSFQAIKNNASYEAPLSIKIRLNIFKSKEIKEQNFFFTNFPLMTNRATFIVNGIEKVPISQLIRSYGVFFTREIIDGKNYFGAKVIPRKGSWIEFQTDSSGAIYVKIDKKKKIPVTFLLKIFGKQSDQEIKELFKDVEIGEIKYIEETIKKYPGFRIEDILLFFYHKLRPGSLATINIAKRFAEEIFSYPQRYDLSEVGRWKFWQRLPETNSLFLKQNKNKKTQSLKDQKIYYDQKITRTDRSLKIEDIIAIIREIIVLNNNPQAKEDSIDHLSNRRLRSAIELLQDRLRVGLTRMERSIKGKMSIIDSDNINLNQIINPLPFASQVKSFFFSSQICQFMDGENFLAETEHRQRISLTGPGGLVRERTGLEARDIQPSFYGRICPIKTPEGQNIGLVNHLTMFAKINKHGFIETPYYRVKDGKVSSKKDYLTAIEEERYYIASADTLINKKKEIISQRVGGRKDGLPIEVDKVEVEYLDISPNQILSFSAGLIPFLQNNEASRSLMGANMLCQAVPLVNPSPPLVMTGIEREIVKGTNGKYVIRAEMDGTVEEVDAEHIVIKPKTKKQKPKTYHLKNFIKSNAFTCYHERSCVTKGQKLKTGDIIIRDSTVNQDCLALGQNILVAFMSWRGLNFEDAIILSERMVRDNTFSSVHIQEFSCDVRDTKLGPEITTIDIPNVSEEKLKELDAEGIIREGATVVPGSILVGKITPKGKDEMNLTPEERLLKSIFQDKMRQVKNSSLVLPHGKKGKVIGVEVFSCAKGDKLSQGVIKKIQIQVAQFRNIEPGDKMSGRHGNKGVVAVILPLEEMPFLADGTPVDVILNPSGVISRINLGQLLEAHLGLAAHKLGYHAVTPSLFGATEKEISKEFAKAKLTSDRKTKIFDPRTGQPISNRVVVGYIYMMKLIHMVEDKIHMRSIGPCSLITQQPLGGKSQFGGQRFGEMEGWALEGYGAASTLHEMLTVKSDDVYGRRKIYESILYNKPIKLSNITSTSSNLLISEIRALSLNIQITKKPARVEKVLSLSPQKQSETIPSDVFVKENNS